jgi:hypothetical protein
MATLLALYLVYKTEELWDARATDESREEPVEEAVHSRQSKASQCAGSCVPSYTAALASGDEGLR